MESLSAALLVPGKRFFGCVCEKLGWFEKYYAVEAACVLLAHNQMYRYKAYLYIDIKQFTEQKDGPKNRIGSKIENGIANSLDDCPKK